MFDNLLTDFIGPDENPLSDGGNWTQTSTIRPPMQRLGNNATDSSHGDPNYSHWTTTFPSGTGDAANLYAFACIEGGQLGAALETWRVGLWTTVGATVFGYRVFYGGGIGKTYSVASINGNIGVATTIATGGGGYPERLGIRIFGPVVQAWGMYAGVWTLAASGLDTTYRGDFYPGIGIEDPTAGGLSMSCFGAGVETNRTQIYRILRGLDQ